MHDWLFDLASGSAGALAAAFWAMSAAVKIPKLPSTDEAKAAGTGVGMGEMNDTLHKLAVALRSQAGWSKWGAGFAALAAIVQVSKIFF